VILVIILPVGDTHAVALPARAKRAPLIFNSVGNDNEDDHRSNVLGS
jgi:hypothetical protein